MSNILLKANNISHGFESTLFSNISLTLSSASSIAIIGRSGCGKSTLLHIFSTFIKPNEGSVALFNQEVYKLKERKIESLRRYEIGIIFQFHYLFKGMSALENIEVATMLSGEEIDEKIFEALEIKELMQHKIGELSGGQQQRVSVARVLSKKPRIVFADEPTGNLDKETAELVFNVLLEYIKAHNAGLILVTHDEILASQCDTIYRLEDKLLKERA